MKIVWHSYRYAREILNDNRYADARNQLEKAIQGCPLFVWPGKSSRNGRLDVVQQLLNVYFERRFHVDMGWDLRPNATAIAGSNLKADFRKEFEDLVIQAEIQFGNMSRWYSDLFKFQAGYSGQQVRMGVSILPSYALAVRIDSNVAHFERAIRELPAAEFSITLPIITFGIDPVIGEGPPTQIIDVSKSKYKNVIELIGRGRVTDRWRIVNNIINGVSIEDIGPSSEIGPYPGDALISDDE